MIRNISDIFFLIAIFCIVFITVTTAPYLGIKQVYSFSTLLLFISSIVFIINNQYILYKKSTKPLLYYFIIVFIIAIKINFTNDFLNSILFLKNWLTPAFILIYLENIKSNKRILLKNVLILFFITECFLSIYERYSNTLIFGSLESIGLTEFYDERINNINTIFRSMSLLGHPLNNAHLVCIMLSIILNTTIKLNYKNLLLVLGIFSILCFNARAATIIILLVSFMYLHMIKNKLSKNQITKLFIFFFLSISLIIYLMFNTSLGGRLINGDKLIDGSAEVRLKAFYIFNNFFNNKDILLGNFFSTPNELTENGYLNLMIILGIPFALLFLFFQINLIQSRLHHFTSIGKIIIFLSFFVLGMTNNNLAQPDSIMMLFIWLPAFKNNYL